MFVFGGGGGSGEGRGYSSKVVDIKRIINNPKP